MYRWISLMTVKTRNHDQDQFRLRSLSSSRSFCVRSRPRPSPLSDYLYSPPPSSPAPYSQFFGSSRQQSSSSSGSSESSALTSPGRISPGLRSESTSSSVYSELYRPDLIKLSSPVQRSSSFSPAHGTPSARKEFTRNWIKDNQHL